MTIVQLQYLLAVANHGSFSMAAKTCFVTQPTLSMQIQNLEEELGVKIFDRSKKPLLATEAGKKVLEQAKVIIAESKRMKEIISEFQGKISGQLRIAILPTIAAYLLPLFVPSFVKKHPDVILRTEELTTDEILDRLRKDSLDAAIVATPLEEKGINEIPLFEEQMFAYVSPKHPWSKLKSICLDQIQLHELWLLKEEHCFRSQALQICNANIKNNNHTNFVFESGSLETLKRLVEEYDGITILPELATLSLSAKQRKLLKPFRRKHPHRQISIITSRNYIKLQLLVALKEEIIKKLPKELLKIRKGVVVPVIL